MNIRAVLLDFDGTALQKDQVHISPRNMRAIRQAISRGIEIIPCTGRCEDMFPPQIEAEKRIRYWITAKGARVVDRESGEILYSSLFTPDESAAVCRIFEGQHIYSEISAGGRIYMENEVCAERERYPVPSHHVWFLEANRQICVGLPSKYFLENRIGIEKVNIYGVPPVKRASITDALMQTGVVTISDFADEGADIQFFPKRQSRLRAMEALLDKLGFGFENVMGIGDSTLDLDMIRHAAIGVAMGNASKEVKAAADYVTAPFDEDGVAQALETFLF